MHYLGMAKYCLLKIKPGLDKEIRLWYIFPECFFPDEHRKLSHNTYFGFVRVGGLLSHYSSRHTP